MSINKICALACTLCLALPTAGYSQVLLYDGFSGTDYTAGSAAGVPYGGIGVGYATGGAWNNNDFADGGLAHPTLVTTPGVRVVRTDGDMEANLDVSAGGTFDSAGLVGNEAIGGEGVSGTLYYSYLGREMDGNGDGWGGFNLWNNAGGGDEHLGVGNGGTPNDYVAFHIDGNTEPPITTPPTPIDGDVHFFVIRGDYVGDGQDTYTVWQDPDPLLAELDQAAGTSIMVNTRPEDGNGFNQFRFRGDNSTGQWEFDEVRFGTTWGDVTPTVPEPASGLLALFGIGLISHLRRRGK